MPGDCLAEFLKSRFDDADKNRKSLQDKWESNRSYYLGVATDRWKKGEGDGWRSKSFPGSTHQKVIYAVALVIDTVLSGGKIPFMYKPSGFEKNRVRVSGPVDPKIVERAIQDMTSLCEQQLVDCKAEAAYIKNVLSAALYGWTYGKFIVYNMTRSGWESVTPEVPGVLDWSRLPNTAQTWQKWEESFNAPGYLYVPLWDIYRDWEIDDLHECSFIGQRQIVNNYWLRQKKGKPYFIDANIEEAITASKTKGSTANPQVSNTPETNSLTPALRDVQARSNTQKYFEMWGRVPRNVIEEFEKDLLDNKQFKTSSLTTEEDTGDEIEVCVCSYNDERIVRYARIMPIMRPYYQARWEDPGDELAPIGIADNCKQMHNVLKGTFRAIEDNVKLSANVIVAMKERYFQKIPESLEPGTKLLLTEDCDDARKAMQQVNIENVSQPLMELLKVVREFLDDDSMVPKITQGIREPGDQTAAEASMRQAAASKYIGMAIRNLDEGIIEPLVTDFYRYNMDDPDIQVGKGNYIVQALGFTSFMNKTTRVQMLQNVLNLILSNDALIAESKVRFYLEEIIKSLEADPDQGLKSDEDKQMESRNAQNSPEAALQIQGAEAEVEKTQSETMKNKSVAAKNIAEMDKKTVEAEQTSLETQARVMTPEGVTNEPV